MQGVRKKSMKEQIWGKRIRWDMSDSWVGIGDQGLEWIVGKHGLAF